MKRHIIAGGGGTPLQVMETGNDSGRSILFLHGFSQCWLAWSRQLSSDLAISHRLIAMDCEVTGSQASLATHTAIRSCGPMTSSTSRQLRKCT
jgi:hypothetical protein